MTIDLSSLNLIEKFIVEHGSAAVMGVHINLLREQLSALDREATNLKSQVAQLESANKDLTEQLQKRAAENHRLQVAAQQKQDSERDRTDEEYRVLSEVAHRRSVSDFGISIAHEDISGERALMLLRGLASDGLVERSNPATDERPYWSLTDIGRDHMHKRGKL